MEKNGTLASPAIARASNVLPVPGAPTINVPRGIPQRWSDDHLRSHEVAAEKLGLIVQQAFRHVGQTLASGPTEHDVAELIRQRFREEGLQATDGPIVAINEHASDPHFEPTPETSTVIRMGDWLLIDLWGRLEGDDTMFADITWTAYVGDAVPDHHRGCSTR